jgi:hypothetical protein
VCAASQYLTAGIPENRNNGDEDLYANKIGNFTKGLHHNNLGGVDVNAYQRRLDALQGGSPAAVEPGATPQVRGSGVTSSRTSTGG